MNLLSVHVDHAGRLKVAYALVNTGVFERVLEVDVELFVPENPVLAVIFCALVCPDHVSDELAMIDTIAQSPQVLENVLSPLVEVVLLVVERTLNVDGAY